jgi:hypothetical protein
MDFLKQKKIIKINDLRIGNIVLYGSLFQSHIITGINLNENSVKICPKNHLHNDISDSLFNTKELIVPIKVITSASINLNNLNDYGFIWEKQDLVYFIINGYKFFVYSYKTSEASISYESDKFAVKTTVYSLHELQNIFKTVSGVDFIDINKF